MDFHGGNIYKVFREKNIKEILDYSSNINPYGVPKSLKQKIAENIGILEKYPDPDYVELREKLAQLNKVELENIVLGNGATEAIFLFIKVIKPEKVLIVSPTFGEYERAVRAWDSSENREIEIEYFELEEKDGFRLNIGKLKKELEKKYDLAIICNPNNPTGKFLKMAETREYDKLAQILRENVDIDKVYEIMGIKWIDICNKNLDCPCVLSLDMVTNEIRKYII